MTKTKITPEARYTLTCYGITLRQWALYWSEGAHAAWYGDVCGCVDDRCAGHHHDEEEECACFDTMLMQYLAARTVQL